MHQRRAKRCFHNLRHGAAPEGKQEIDLGDFTWRIKHTYHGVKTFLFWIRDAVCRHHQEVLSHISHEGVWRHHQEMLSHISHEGVWRHHQEVLSHISHEGVWRRCLKHRARARARAQAQHAAALHPVWGALGTVDAVVVCCTPRPAVLWLCHPWSK